MNQLLQEYIIKKEKEKPSEEHVVEKARTTKDKEIKENATINGGYCNFSCMHCFEEFLNSDGEIVGDFTSGVMFDYYCNLGHSVAFGRFCEDYE